MKETNRLSADYWDRVVNNALLICLRRVERYRDMLTAGGRMYGQVKVTPEIKEQLDALEAEGTAQAAAAIAPQTEVM